MHDEIQRLIDQHHSAGAFLNQSVFQLANAVEIGDIIDRRYRIIQLLGRGGMGEVYEAEDLELKDHIAIKLLRGGSGHRALHREILAARRVTHPNVSRVFDAGSHDLGDGNSTPYVTMELLRGETLQSHIRRLGRLNQQQAFALALQLAEGLSAAHQAGVIHRDFKSVNVMLVEAEGAPRAVITDFGLARMETPAAAATADTETAHIKGTVAYMSPEQFSGNNVTAASDIYSFGIVLYEMATGHVPFDGQHLLNVAVQKSTGKIPGLRGDSSEISAHWEGIIERCLQPSPEDRYASCEDLARAFRPQFWQVPRPHWTRKQWGWAGLGAAVIAIAASGLVYWTLQPYQPDAVAMDWYQKGITAFEAASYDSARKSLDVAVERDPRFASAYAYRAAALTLLDDPDAAKESMLQAHQAARDVRVSAADQQRIAAFEAYILRDFDRAHDLLAELAQGAANRPAALTEVAIVDVARSNLPSAAKALEEALRVNPTFGPARLRLGWVLAQQRKFDAAMASFAEAEKLFRAGSQFDALAETAFQRAVYLTRSGRTQEALPVIEQAMELAVSTGDTFHHIRLKLALSMALQMSGQLARARAQAAESIDLANNNGAERAALVGLLDLGNTYYGSGEPAEAENYFKQGLALARRSKARTNEARALLSLGSLFVQSSRTAEAVPNIQAALPFYREHGYRLETMQALLLLGAAQTDLADFELAEKSLQDAIAAAIQIQNPEQEGTVHSYLGDLYLQIGRWPAAIEEYGVALERNANARGGAPATTYLIARARTYARMGLFTEAAKDLAAAQTRLPKLEGAQKVRRTAWAVASAELALYQRRWADMGRFAALAAAAGGGRGDMFYAKCLAGLAQLRAGLRSGAAACQTAIRDAAAEGRPVAKEQLLLAEALGDLGRSQEARRLATAACDFYVPRKVHEAMWRCGRLAPGASPVSFDDLRQQWPATLLQTYSARPDLKPYIR